MELVTKVRFEATASQIGDFELMCDRNETMLAATLAQRLEGCTEAERYDLIRGWFNTVRQMAVASHIMSGIKAELIRDDQPLKA